MFHMLLVDASAQRCCTTRHFVASGSLHQAAHEQCFSLPTNFHACPNRGTGLESQRSRRGGVSTTTNVPACWMRSTHSVGVVEDVSLATDRIDHTVIAAFGAVQRLATPRQARVLLPRFTRKIWHLCTEREGADKSATVKLRHPTTSRVNDRQGCGQEQGLDGSCCLLFLAVRVVRLGSCLVETIALRGWKAARRRCRRLGIDTSWRFVRQLAGR